MADRKYYVLCESNCKFESMTKEQIIAAIAEATGNTVTDVDAAFITKIKEQNRGTAVKIWVGTQAEYNALVASGSVDDETLYCTSDGSAITLLKDEVARISKTVDDVNEVLQQGITDCNERINENANNIIVLENRVAGVEAASGGVSGVVPISQGGTGASSVALARYNLGLGNTSGALPVANGGTGVTSKAAIRNMLGLGNTTGELPVANGGTGASNAPLARINLGIHTKTIEITFNSNTGGNAKLGAAAGCCVATIVGFGASSAEAAGNADYIQDYLKLAVVRGATDTTIYVKCDAKNAQTGETLPFKGWICRVDVIYIA